MRRVSMISCLAMLVGYLTLSATPSTQIWIPSTDIQKFMNPHIGWDVYIGEAKNSIISNGGITIGVLPFSKVGLEVGIDYRDFGGSLGHADPILFNAKFGVPEDAFFKYMPALAVGGYDFGTKEDATTYNIVYGLAAKNIWKLGRFSVGGFYGGVGSDPDLLFATADGETENAGVLASWDRVISEVSDKLWAAVDFQSGKSGYGAVSFGIAYNFAPNAGVLFGYDIYNDSDTYKPTFTLQFDINAF